MKKIRIPNTETGKDNYVTANHIETFKTSRNMNAALYKTKKGQNILVIDANGTIVGGKEYGIYISEDTANTLIEVSNTGNNVDYIVRDLSI